MQDVLEDQLAAGLGQLKDALDNAFDPLAFDPTFNKGLETAVPVFKEDVPSQSNISQQLGDDVSVLKENLEQATAEIQKEL